MKSKISFPRFIVIFTLFILGYCSSPAHTSGLNIFNAAFKKLRLPDYDGAYNDFKRYSVSCDSVNNHPQLAQSLNKLAEIALIKGNYNEAIEYLNRSIRIDSLSISLKKEDFKNLIESYHLMGNLYYSKGDIEVAGEYFRTNRNLVFKYFPEDKSQIARSYIDLSSYFSFKIEIDSEYYYAYKAYKLRTEVNKSDILFSRILLRYAYAFKVFERQFGYDKCYPRVRAIFIEALSHLDRIYSRPSVEKSIAFQSLANSYADYIFIYTRQDTLSKRLCYGQALNLYLQALRIKEQVYGKNSSSYATTCYTIALLNKSCGYADTARQWYQRAVDCLTKSYNPALHLTGGERINTNDPYLLNIILTNQSELLYIKYKNRKDLQLLKDIHRINLHRIILWRQIFASFKSKDLGSVIAKWNHAPFEEAIGTAYELYRSTQDYSFLNDIFLFAEESKNNDFIRDFDKKDGHLLLNPELLPRIVNIRKAQEVCKSTKSALLAYVSSDYFDQTGFGIIVTESSIYVHRFSIDKVDSLRMDMKKAMRNNDADKYAEFSYELYQLILEPLLISISDATRNIIISSCGALQNLAFDALVSKYDKKSPADFRQLNYLVYDYYISYALSASLLNYQLNLPASKSKSLTAFYPSVKNMPELVFSKTLFDQLKSCRTGNYFEKDKAGKSSFLANTHEQAALQIFTHARADDNEYERSSFYLSGNPFDSVTISDIYTKNIKSDLTVLACCESGAGPEQYGEGAKSFLRAFTFSGSKSVIGTQWCVDEKSTIAILTVFYKKMSLSGSISVALNNSKREYLKSCRSSEAANPFYWAGIIACGCSEIEPLSCLRSNYQYAFFWIFIFIMCVGGLIYLLKMSQMDGKPS
jgi:CHAT domain-containing protein